MGVKSEDNLESVRSLVQPSDARLQHEPLPYDAYGCIVRFADCTVS